MTQKKTTPSRFSLILATYGRGPEVRRFLESLAVQTCQCFELIVIDQNHELDLEEILRPYKSRFPIIYLRSKLGLSRARNVGLRHACGQIVAFPDDDCYYPKCLLRQIDEQFRCHSNWQGISCIVLDENGRFSCGGYMSSSQTRITRGNIWRCATSPGLFLMAMVPQTIGGFDPALGVGSGTPWGSAEESSYVLDALSHGIHIEYVPGIRVLHPRYEGSFDRGRIARGYSYGLGMGRVLRRHRYSILHATYFAALQMIRSLMALLRGQGRRCVFHAAMASGRFVGWWKTK